MAVNPIPAGYHTVTPYLIVPDAEKLIDFVAHVFGADEKPGRITSPEGKISHTEVQLGTSMLMVAEATEQFPATNTMLHLYLHEVDDVYRKAMAKGAVSTREPANQFYGDRVAGFNACGIQWFVGVHIEDVSPEEMQKRAAEYKPEE